MSLIDLFNICSRIAKGPNICRNTCVKKNTPADLRVNRFSPYDEIKPFTLILAQSSYYITADEGLVVSVHPLTPQISLYPCAWIELSSMPPTVSVSPHYSCIWLCIKKREEKKQGLRKSSAYMAQSYTSQSITCCVWYVPALSISPENQGSSM